MFAQYSSEQLIVGVVGAGAMGQGIVQVSVQGGMKTLVFDAKEGGAAAAVEKITARLERLVEKGRLSVEECEKAVGLMVVCKDLSDLSPCHLVVEAIFENLEVKRKLFHDVEAVVSEDCIIASNTSSIPIASIASACKKRDRIAGFHFFNPVPLMKLVEVIVAADTSSETADSLTHIGKLMTRTPVRVKDSPGFLVNMGGSAFTTEGFMVHHDGVASPAQIDSVMRDCHGFRMGPFELGDLTGIDVNYPVRQIIYNGYNQDPRIKTTPEHKAMFDAGRYGRKTSGGWYDYATSDMQGYKPGDMLGRDAGDYHPQAVSGSVAIISSDERALALCAELGLQVIEDDGSCPIIAAPVGMDATDTALHHAVDYKRLVCLDPMGRHDVRVTMMMAPGASEEVGEIVASSLVQTGRKVTWIKDSCGFIGQRIVAMVANLGCYMAEVGLASDTDIDLAMRLGLNYPHGPLEFIEAYGAQDILAVLEGAQRTTGSDRYRPTPWLRRRARLGISIRAK